MSLLDELAEDLRIAVAEADRRTRVAIDAVLDRNEADKLVEDLRTAIAALEPAPEEILSEPEEIAAEPEEIPVAELAEPETELAQPQTEYGLAEIETGTEPEVSNSDEPEAIADLEPERVLIVDPSSEPLDAQELGDAAPIPAEEADEEAVQGHVTWAAPATGLASYWSKKPEPVS